MATTKIAIDDTAFVLASSATDVLVQNINTGKVLYAFDSSLPTVDADAGVLNSGGAVQKSGSLPTGNLYVRMASGTGSVAVSE